MSFIIFILALLVFYKVRIPQTAFIIAFVITIVCVIFANRSILVPDTSQYIDMYRGDSHGNYEKGYIFLCDFFRGLGISFSSFLFIISFIGLSIWFYITQKIVNKKFLLLAFVIYLSYMGIYYHGIVLRACLAILINYIGIYYGLIKSKNYVFFYICVCASALFHLSAILFAPLPYIVQRKYSSKALYIVLVASFCFMLFNKNITFITDILSGVMDKLLLYGGGRLAGYIEKADTATLSLTHIKYFFTGIALIYLSQFVRRDYANCKNFNLFFNTYILGIVLMFLFAFAPGSARIAQLFLFFEFLPFILLYEGIERNKRFYMKIFIFMLIVMNIINLYSLAPALWNYCS